MLTPDQFEKNKAIPKSSNQRVDFAIKMPNTKQNKQNNEPLWLPVDSKFPLMAYEEYLTAFDENDFEKVKKIQKDKDISKAIKKRAKEINKYIHPPLTTDFAIMFLPIEGLYVEVLRDVTLQEELRRDFKIFVTGPNAFTAHLTMLQLGFKTLAIEKKAAEVWDNLHLFKKGFYQFGGLLEKAQKKIQEAGNVIDDANSKTKSIDKKLQKMEDPFQKEGLTFEEDSPTNLLGE